MESIEDDTSRQQDLEFSEEASSSECSNQSSLNEESDENESDEKEYEQEEGGDDDEDQDEKHDDEAKDDQEGDEDDEESKGLVDSDVRTQPEEESCYQLMDYLKSGDNSGMLDFIAGLTQEVDIKAKPFEELDKYSKILNSILDQIPDNYEQLQQLLDLQSDLQYFKHQYDEITEIFEVESKKLNSEIASQGDQTSLLKAELTTAERQLAAVLCLSHLGKRIDHFKIKERFDATIPWGKKQKMFEYSWQNSRSLKLDFKYLERLIRQNIADVRSILQKLGEVMDQSKLQRNWNIDPEKKELIYDLMNIQRKAQLLNKKNKINLQSIKEVLRSLKEENEINNPAQQALYEKYSQMVLFSSNFRNKIISDIEHVRTLAKQIKDRRTLGKSPEDAFDHSLSTRLRRSLNEEEIGASDFRYVSPSFLVVCFSN